MVICWCYIIIYYPNNRTILLFDRYDIDNSSKVILEESGVKYLASLNSFRFKAVEKDLEPKVTKEGEWGDLYDPASGHTIIHYCSPNKKLGRK